MHALISTVIILDCALLLYNSCLFVRGNLPAARADIYSFTVVFVRELFAGFYVRISTGLGNFVGEAKGVGKKEKVVWFLSTLLSAPSFYQGMA